MNEDKVVIDNTEETDYSELEKLSIQELKEEISEARSYISYCEDLIVKKKVEELPYEGKYLKIREMDSYKYLFCDSCHYTTNHYGKKCIYLKGVGFYSDFGPYEDNNFVGFTTWEDIWMDLHQYELYNKLREQGREDRDYYTITEITKEEYQNKFYNMITKLTETFEKWKE